MRRGIPVLFALLLVQACSGKRSPEGNVNGSGTSGTSDEYAPGKVIGTADGRWLVIDHGQVYSASRDAVWGQLKRGDYWQMALAPGLSPEGTFVIADGSVFWIANDAGTLVRTRLPEGPEPLLVADPKARSAGRVVASDGTAAFWRVDGHLVGAPLAGGPIRTLAQSEGDGPILVEGRLIYHATGDRLESVSSDGTGPNVVASGQGHVIAIASAPDRIVWLTADGAVRAVPRAGGDIKELAHGLAQPTGVTVAGDTIYVSAGPEILRLPLEGGKQEVVVAKAGAPVSPRIDGNDLLWIDAKEHQVYKRPLSR